GDAGGLVDPVTGEGLYYAVRSGDLASQVILADVEPHRREEQYRQMILRDFGLDLTYGAALAKRLFCGVAIFGAVPTRMIDFMRRSPRFCEIMQDLFAGTQPYLDLKSRLLQSLNGTLHEILMSFFFRRLVLGQTRVLRSGSPKSFSRGLSGRSREASTRQCGLSAASAGPLASSRAGKAPTCSMSTATTTSITSAR